MSGYRYVSLNSEVCPADEACLSVFDTGFMLGDGVFETIRVYRGRLHLWKRHCRRLRRGVEALEIEGLPADDELHGAAIETLKANEASEAGLRLTVTRGIPGRGPTVLITLRPLLQNEKFSHAMIVPQRRTALEHGTARLKSLSYQTSALALRRAAAAGAGEGILLTDEGFVAEGAVTNLFCVRRGELVTPPVALNILPGITRERVIELARESGIRVHANLPFYPSFMMEADECFATNALRELVPLLTIDGCTIGSGTAGAVTRNLTDRYRAEAPDEEL